MAITPRTVLSRPSTLLLFALGVVAVGGFIGLMVGGQENGEGESAEIGYEFADRDLDAGATDDRHDGAATGDRGGASAAGFDVADHTCKLEPPEEEWTESHWMRHLECMDARGESLEAILDETEEAIDAVGLTADLAVEKAERLETFSGDDDYLAFLEEAVDELGPGDGRLVHRLAQALTWRGERTDFERIRHLQLLSRALMSDDCGVLQTEVWVRYHIAHRFAERPSPAAFDGVRSAIDTYLARNCDRRRHTGKWDALTEIVGVGIAADMVDGHDGDSMLIGEVTDSFEIRRLDSFCRRAVPDYHGLRDYCTERLSDELDLARD